MAQKEKKTLGTLGPAARLSAARWAASERFPYFAGGFAELVPHEVPGSHTIGVTREGILFYDPEEFAHTTGPEAAALYTHEYLHIFLNHYGRFEELVRRGVAQRSDQKDWNTAADAEIDDDLEDAGLPLPPGYNSATGKYDAPMVTPTLLGFSRHLTAEQYFHLLLEQRKKGGKGGGPKAKGPPVMQPECGSGAGNPNPHEPEAKFKEAFGRDPVEQQVSRRAAAERVQERQRARGDVPAGLAAYAGEQLPEAKIPWQDKLRSAALDAAAFITGEGDYTWTQRFRGQPALEQLYGDDAPVLPGEHEPMADVAVVFDTSGSVSDEDLSTFAAETKGVLECLGGMHVTFLACDAAVHRLVEVTSVEEVLRNLKGRGGTDFRPAFAALDKLPKRPDLVVFMTDLYGPAPEQPPPYRVIWAVTPGGGAAPWGETVQLE